MAEQPPLSRIHVIGYSANDRNFPLLAQVLDPRVAGYKVPEDFSACPDKRYPNHIFTGAQPISGDQRVRHTWEILPSPWVPFTRYDDDLGPIQGRRRSVKNEGQQASLTSSTKISYEGREGSSIVSNEIEETWQIKVDEDGNSLFPVRIRDFYDSSRGAVEERRQLFVPTGEEVATLENVNGIITQTSYEPYNEYLSYKVIQTYAVDGPQLVGKSTDNDGQLITVTTQRKASDNYVAPQPTATRTVEASREDAESIVERVVDTPEVFSSKIIGKEATDPAPAKFRIAAPSTTEEETVEGVVEEPVFEDGDISKSEQQVNKFVKRIRSTFRNLLNLPKTLTQKSTNDQRQVVTITETLQVGDTTVQPTATRIVESEALGDGTYIVRKSEVPSVFPNKTISVTKSDLTPEKFKANQLDTTIQQNVTGDISSSLTLLTGQFAKSEEQVNEFVKRVSTTSRNTSTTSSLTEYVLTPDRQLAKKKLTLSSQPQTIDPDSKLVDGSIEELGDGRTIKTEIRVDEVFDSKTETLQKPDVVPEKFKSNAATIKTETVVAGDTIGLLSLEANEYLKSGQRLTEHTIQKTTVTRPDNLNEVSGRRLEENWGIGLPYKEYVSENSPSGDNVESDGIGASRFIVREYNKSELESVLGSFNVVLPTSIDLDLPRELKDITVKWQEEKSSSQNNIDISGAMGQFKSLTQQDGGSLRSSLSLIPKVEVEFEEIWGKNIQANIHLFFLKKDNITTEQIRNKCGASEIWPVFKPKSFYTTIFGKEETKTLEATVSRSMEINSTDVGYGYQPSKKDEQFSEIKLIPIGINIPPCITGQRLINEQKQIQNDGLNIEIKYPEIIIKANGATVTLPPVEITKPLVHSLNSTVSFIVPAVDGQTSIPKNGIYLVNSSAEPFKFGWFLIRAVTFDASTLG